VVGVELLQSKADLNGSVYFIHREAGEAAQNANETALVYGTNLIAKNHRRFNEPALAGHLDLNWKCLNDMLGARHNNRARGILIADVVLYHDAGAGLVYFSSNSGVMVVIITLPAPLTRHRRIQIP
jgi:hypothetical protein